MRKALFYVSGHGFGHAVRAAQVARALRDGMGFDIAVRTSAPRWLFPLSRGVAVEMAEVDPGPAQKDLLTTDIPATLSRFTRMMDGMDAAVERELEVIERLAPSVIVCDIAPLGVNAAARARIPSVVVANFLWDWILADYARFEPAFTPIVERLGAIYRRASVVLKTPLSGGLENYGNVADIPLIARRSPKTREQARGALGLPRDRPLALISLGGVGSERFYEGLDRRVTTVDMVTLGGEDSQRGRLRRFRNGDVAHEDLLAASDVVIGKMGYGLCSGLVARPRPFLYTPRDDFVEYNVLASETKRYVAVEEVSRDEFFNARLDRWIQKLLSAAKARKPAPVDISGARAAARRIAAKAPGGTI
ncbi:MAG: hypothetical protein ACNS63_05310 [Candidatus Nitrospinota bacterium M3_3B_026]